jgi:hypothetical protein
MAAPLAMALTAASRNNIDNAMAAVIKSSNGSNGSASRNYSNGVKKVTAVTTRTAAMASMKQWQ